MHHNHSHWFFSSSWKYSDSKHLLQSQRGGQDNVQRSRRAERVRRGALLMLPMRRRRLRGGTVLTVNMEGGGGAALAQLVLGLHAVFATVFRAGAAYLQTQQVPRTADADVGRGSYLQAEPTLGYLAGAFSGDYWWTFSATRLTITLSFNHSTCGEGSPETSQVNLTCCPSTTFCDLGWLRKCGAAEGLAVPVVSK